MITDYACASPRLYIPSDYNPQTGLAGSPATSPRSEARVPAPVKPAKTYHQLTTAHDSVFDLNGIERTFFAKAVAEARTPFVEESTTAKVISAVPTTRSTTPSLLTPTTSIGSSNSGPSSPSGFLPSDVQETSAPGGPNGQGAICDGRSARSKRRLYSSSASNCSSDSERSSSPSGGKYVCLECGKHYATSSNLSRHKQTHRSPDSQLAKKCPTCDKVSFILPKSSPSELRPNFSG